MRPFSSSNRRQTSNISNSSSAPAPAPALAGFIVHKDQRGHVLGRKKIYTNHDVVFGRDTLHCQYVLPDPYVSKRHLRVYTVVYANDEPNEIDVLVYAEDLSHNGTFWNGSLIGKGNGGFLLCHGDILRLSRNTNLSFVALTELPRTSPFDLTQEREMARFREKFVVTDRLLGAGAFGKVFMAIEQRSRIQIACKVVDIRKMGPRSTPILSRLEVPAAANEVNDKSLNQQVKKWVHQKKREMGVEEKLQQYFREVEILASLNHPNIINIAKVYITDHTIYIMQDLVTAGDLFSYIESKNGKLLEAEAAVIIRQLLIAVDYLHQQNIVHRDIKPDNILMTSMTAGCRVVLTDFGAARRTYGKMYRMSTMIGTHEYAAPEMLDIQSKPHKSAKKGYTRAVDMWALGCVSVVLLTGGLAFFDPATGLYSERLAKACDLAYLQKSAEWQCVRKRPKGFVENLLILDEDARMTAKEALNHVWFSNDAHKADFEDLYQRTIKHWRPRVSKANLVEFVEDGAIKALECSQDYLKRLRKRSHPRRRDIAPVEAPLKPFPRAMHLALWPLRDNKDRLSEDVLSAIENNRNTNSESGLNVKARLENPPLAQSPPSSELGRSYERLHTSRNYTRRESALERTQDNIGMASKQTLSRDAFESVFKFPAFKDTKHKGPRENTKEVRPQIPRGFLSSHASLETTCSPPTDIESVHIRTEDKELALQEICHESQEEKSGDNNPVSPDSAISSQSQVLSPIKGKLKRRASRLDLGRGSFRREKRNGSIFDLVKDGDDGDSQPLTSTSAISPIRRNTSNSRLIPNALYLPR